MLNAPKNSAANYLPNELLAHILEYLPLSDYPNISSSNKNLYTLTRDSYVPWSRTLMIKILDPFAEDQSSNLSLILPRNFKQGLFQDMLKPQQIFQNRAQIYNELNKFVGNYLSSDQKEILVEELFNVLQNPPPPKPCLKRDYQCFQTNTMFQNFLTEVHFQLNKRNYLRDMKCSLVESLLDEIQIQFEPSDSNLQGLTNVALSLLNTKTQNSPFHKQMKQLNASFESNGSQSDQGSKGSAKGKVSPTRRGRKASRQSTKRRLTKSKDEESEEEMIQALQGKPDDAAKLLELIYIMAQNYCQMVRSYMAGIQEPMVFLNEYLKLWENYVMITINLDETFGCLSEYVSEAYNHIFGYNNNDSGSFSVWKLMIKAWTTEVFAKVSDCLASILSSASYDLRGQKKSSANNEFDFEREEVIKLIQEVYYAIGDLSYNESTVFFSDCATVNSDTPKAVLDVKILGTIKALYKEDELLEKNDVAELKAVFEEDAKLIKKLFGKELKYHVLDLQACLLKEGLEGLFEAGVDQIEYINYSFNARSNTRKMDFNKIFSHIKVSGEQKQKVENDKQYQSRMIQAILGECALFEDFVDLMSKIKEEIRVENIEASQKAMKLFERGFSLTKDQKPMCSQVTQESSFFTFEDKREPIQVN